MEEPKVIQSNNQTRPEAGQEIELANVNQPDVFTNLFFFGPILVTILLILFLMLYPVFGKGISVEDQVVRPGGLIQIKSINLNKPAFLSIEASQEGGFANVKIAGTLLLTDKSYRNIALPVRTDEAVEPEHMQGLLQSGKELTAVLYEDSDGDGIHTETDNKVVTNLIGIPSSVTFKIQ